jgi:transcriptional regulator GlxA family with amidase domain
MVDAPVTAPIRLGPQLDITRGAGASWVRLLRMLTADAGQPDGLALHPVLGEYLQESLVAGLLLAGDHQYRHLLDEPVAVAAPGAIRRAVEAMRAEPGRSFTVATLADIAGISSRSLQHGFRRYLGVSPMAYLRSLRLAAAHDELRLADAAQVTVSQIAYRYGFLHLGRFAAVYRARYGVSPAQTLRR